MGDRRVVGTPQESLPDDGSLESEEELSSWVEDVIPYGTALTRIQRSDRARCSSLGIGPSERFSESLHLRRLSLELKHFLRSPPRYISVAPIGDNLCKLLCSIEGPPRTPYEKGIFFILVDCPANYPVGPPVCNFITKIRHPNISNGRICVNILEAAWCPALTIETILLSICSMLADPFFDEALEKEVATEYKKDKALYESNARLCTQTYATGTRPTDEELDVASEGNRRLAKALERNRGARRGWYEIDGLSGSS